MEKKKFTKPRINVKEIKKLSTKGKVVLFAAILCFFVLLLRCCSLGEYIGTFDLSHYCLESRSGYHICGNSSVGCGGDELVPEKSLAVPKYLLEKYPVGTEVTAVYPDGSRHNFIIHDTGGALARLNRIDLAVETHAEAMSRGVIEGVKLYVRR